MEEAKREVVFLPVERGEHYTLWRSTQPIRMDISWMMEFHQPAQMADEAIFWLYEHILSQFEKRLQETCEIEDYKLHFTLYVDIDFVELVGPTTDLQELRVHLPQGATVFVTEESERNDETCHGGNG